MFGQGLEVFITSVCVLQDVIVFKVLLRQWRRAFRVSDQSVRSSSGSGVSHSGSSGIGTLI